MKEQSTLCHVDSGPVGRTLFAFALPVLISQLVQEAYNSADCMVVGRFAGQYALAAAGVSGVLMSTLINFFLGFSSGISAVTSRLFGARDEERLPRVITSVFRLVLISGAVLGLGLELGIKPVLALLRCPPTVMEDAAVYLGICALGVPAQLTANVAVAVLRSFGDTRTPLLYQVISSVCNLVLDLALVAGLGMGLAGAAGATVFSQWMLSLLLLTRLRRQEGGCALRLLGPGCGAGELAKLMKSGIPAGLQALFMSISSLLLQTQINGFGPDAVAGMTVFAKLEGCLYLPCFAYGIALTGFVGQNLGARQPERICEAVRMSLKVSVCSVLPLSLLLTWLSPTLLRLFTDDEGILFNAGQAVRCVLPFYTLYAVNQVFLGAVKGLGNTTWPMVCTLVCYSLFRVVWCRLLIPVYGSMRVVYFSYVVSFGLMLAMILPAYLRWHGLRSLKKPGVARA